MNIKLSLYLFLTSATGFLTAQVATCAQQLETAELAFDQGRLLAIIQNTSFTECINQLSKQEQIRAYKLLIKAHIFTDNEPEAEQAFLALLKVDKEHHLDREDPAELHFLYSKFIITPIFRIGLRAGVNKSFPIVLQEFNTFPAGKKRYNENGKRTGFGIGFSFEGLIERHIGGGIEVAAGIQYRWSSYEVEGDFSGVSYVTVNQSHMVRFPLLIRHTLGYLYRDIDNNSRNTLPYYFLGASYDQLLNASYGRDTERTGGTTFSLPDDNTSLSALDQVATRNVSLLAGAGLKIRTERVNFITIEARYSHSLLNYINSDNRHANTTLINDIGHIEDDLTLNTFLISIGYTHSMYNPVKRKQYR